MNPLIVALYPLKYKDKDFLMNHRKEIEWLLNLNLPEDNPNKAYKKYRGRIIGIMNLVSEKCVTEKGGKTCIYKYKDNVISEFTRYPFLALTRGTVVRWYDNGEAVRLAFPFAKFFNLNEVPATQKLPEKNGTIYEKLDGTLVSCWMDVDGEIRCSTRGMLDNMKAVVGKTGTYITKGENEIISAFLSGINRNTLEDLVKENTTIMFELLGDKPASQCPDVIRCLKHPRPHLLARRVGDSGIEYITHPDVPSPKVYNYEIGRVIELVKELKDMEGFVIHYPGMKYHPGAEWWDYMVKVKSYLYMIKSDVMWGRKGLSYRNLGRAVIVTESPDDIISVFPNEKEYIIKVWYYWSELVKTYSKLLSLAKTKREINKLKGYNLKWLAELVEESQTKGINPLKRFIIKNLPRNKDAVPRYLERITKRIDDGVKVIEKESTNKTENLEPN